MLRERQISGVVTDETSLFFLSQGRRLGFLDIARNVSVEEILFIPSPPSQTALTKLFQGEAEAPGKLIVLPAGEGGRVSLLSHI